ncbi:MAG: amylo-alpha-1,6-glucosidase [Bacteroidetes bacterium]|nr:amylo-alpha-1,6-glucosidase [Bacteroidota bacterium]
MHFTQAQLHKNDFHLHREWLRTSPHGAYASSSLSNCHSRKYHGILVLPDKHEQMQVMLSSLDETLLAYEDKFELATHRYPDAIHPVGYQYLESVDVDEAISWTYRVDQVKFKKTLVLSPAENRLWVKYELLETNIPEVHLGIHPLMAFRDIHHIRRMEPDFMGKTEMQKLVICTEIDHTQMKLYCQVSGKQEFIHHAHFYYHMQFAHEQERGYAYEEDLYCPGYFKVPLLPGKPVIFSAGTKSIPAEKMLTRYKADSKGLKELDDNEAMLKHAASQFIRTVRGGKEIQAGYHWFGRWGRDTCIALPGLTLATHNPQLFKEIISTILKDLKYGLLPNVGKKNEASYNSADAALWCVWAIQQYAIYTQDAGKVWKTYGEALKKILNYHAKGTLNGIHAMSNGLLSASETGKALTWMDAIVDGYPVTPRSGMAVDINALWYNAVCFCLEAARCAGDTVFIEAWTRWPTLIESSFEDVFWDEERGYLADSFFNGVADTALRPNQIFAVSLPYSPLKKSVKKAVVEVVGRELLTPRGLRTLEQRDPNYKGVYAGNVRTRDLAYHQGTVWPWLLGHYAQAYCATHEKRALPVLQKIWDDLQPALTEYCIGTIAEIYDGDPPFEPKGAVSQAWSVAEVLRIRQLLDNLKTENSTVKSAGRQTLRATATAL